MRILVDTHIYLWMLSCPDRLNQKRRYELESPANEVFLSAMSIAELMIKRSIGKIDFEFDPLEMAQKMGLEILKALELSSFEELQRQEKEHGFKEKSPSSDMFFRKGEVGSWREELTQKQVKHVIQDHKEVMRRFNYLDTNDDIVT